MTPGFRVLISMLESKRGNDISHGLAVTCHSWLLGLEGGNDKGEKGQEEPETKQTCSAPQAEVFRRSPVPQLLSHLKRTDPTQTLTRSVALGVGPIHFLKSSAPTHPASLPLSQVSSEGRRVCPSQPYLSAARPTPTPGWAYLGLRQLPLEELQRLRVLPLAVLKGLKLLLQFSLKYTQGLHGGAGHTQPGQSSVGSWGLSCP